MSVIYKDFCFFMSSYQNKDFRQESQGLRQGGIQVIGWRYIYIQYRLQPDSLPTDDGMAPQFPIHFLVYFKLLLITINTKTIYNSYHLVGCCVLKTQNRSQVKQSPPITDQLYPQFPTLQPAQHMPQPRNTSFISTKTWNT